MFRHFWKGSNFSTKQEGNEKMKVRVVLRKDLGDVSREVERRRVV